MLNKPLVSIVMITYGHEKYIREAVEGVLMQSCNFKTELIIVDDCSPDGTNAIILEMKRNHPNASSLIYIKQKKNIGMISNFLFGLQQAEGEYVALCEGDDYWTDPLKLQRQIDFLETHPGYGMSYTACDRYYQELDFHFEAKGDQKNRTEVRFENLLFSNPIRTCTTVIRNSLIKQFDRFMGKEMLEFKMADAPLWLFISMNHNIKFHNEKTAVYRILENSATNVSAYKKFLFRMSRYKVSFFFLRQKFSYSLAWKLLIGFVKETPILILKTILSFLKLYKPKKEKVIKKIIKNK